MTYDPCRKTNIKEILCPNCRKKHLRLKRNPSNPNERDWYCPNKCVYVWPETWFDVFTQFEKFVRREG